MTAAALVFPALRWAPGSGYDLVRPEVAEWLTVGVGGFLLFGGTAEAAAAATTELRERAGRPLLFGADLERGAGQQFEGCTPLPPALALARLGPDAVSEGAELTAREAAGLGVRWLFAPVADVASEAGNPIVGTRALGRSPAASAPAVEAWTRGALRAGGLPCLKHFPGHGRTTEDSHATLPTVAASRRALEADLEPFRAGFAAGAPSVMTAHVAYPAFDPLGRPATVSPAIVTGLLRGELGFDGVVASDALIMAGVGADPAEAAVEAVRAGVDALLYPPDPVAALAALGEALRDGRLNPKRVAEAAERLVRLSRLSEDAGRAEPNAHDRNASRGRAEQWARDALLVPDPWPSFAGPTRAVLIDDDLGGPYAPPSRAPWLDGLRAAGVEVSPGGKLLGLGPDATVLIAVFAEPRGWKGRAGLSREARAGVVDLVARTREARAAPALVLFGDPAWASDLPEGLPVLVAWGGEELMQRAALWMLDSRRVR